MPHMYSRFPSPIGWITLMWFRQSKCCERRGKKIEFPTDTCEETWPRPRGGEGRRGQVCVDTDFSENYIERDREAKGSTVADHVAPPRISPRIGARRNKLVLSSRREYLRGPYTSPMRARWIPNEAAINGGELSALKCDRYVCKMNR